MLDLVKDYIVDVWDLRKARLYDENLSVPQSQCQNASGEPGDVGGGGRLRCLHGKVYTTISYVINEVISKAKTNNSTNPEQPFKEKRAALGGILNP